MIFRAALLVIALVVCGASYFAGWKANGWRWQAKYDRDMVQMYESGRKANLKALEKYRAELEAIRNRPAPKRVYLCPKPPAGGTVSTSPGGREDGPRTDIGPDLYGLADRCDRIAAQLNALIDAVSARKTIP